MKAEGRKGREQAAMSEEELEALLALAITEWAEENPDEIPSARVETFADRGLLTSDCGLVLNVAGSEYQIKILRAC